MSREFDDIIDDGEDEYPFGRPRSTGDQYREPLAQYHPPDNADLAVAGVIIGIGIDTSASTPYIRDGVIYYNNNGGGGGVSPTVIPRANYNNPGTVDNVGTIESIEVDEDAKDGVFRIIDGAVKVPPSTSYEFDPDYFTITGQTVSIKPAALDDLVAEAVDDIAVTVTSNGTLTSTDFGELHYTTTTSAAIDALALDTTVGYS